MALQYSGTVFNTTFTTTTGTRREIVDGIAGVLTSNSWTYVSGSGTGDVMLKSATTPQGSKMCLRVFDPGSGSCAKFFLYNSIRTVNQTGGCFLLPAAAKTFQVTGNGYQFAIYVTGSTSSRDFIMGGTPWLPAWNVTGGISEAGWLMGASDSDGDTTVRPSFRTKPMTVDSGATYPNMATYINNNLWEGNNTNFGVNWGPGIIQLAGVGPQMWRNGQSRTTHMQKWFDGSGYIYEPIIGWHPTSPGTGDALAIGQLWDAAGMSVPFAKDTTSTFDSHNWINLTDNQTGSNTFYLPNSLWLATS